VKNKILLSAAAPKLVDNIQLLDMIKRIDKGFKVSIFKSCHFGQALNWTPPAGYLTAV